MKLILPPLCDRLIVMVYECNGERVIELTDAPGNVGIRGERLEAMGELAGRIFSFKEDNDASKLLAVSRNGTH